MSTTNGTNDWAYDGAIEGINDPADLQSLVAYIQREAEEKAYEILVKAEEDYHYIKSQIVKDQCEQINQEYEDKLRGYHSRCQLQLSKIRNRSRISVLKAKQQEVDALVEHTRIGLKKIINKKNGKYKKLLTGLLVEGLCTCMEPQVEIIIRKGDLSIIESVKVNAVKQFKDLSNLDVQILINNQIYLPPTANGGVILTALQGKIYVNNTLEERLQILCQESLPMIRYGLFGPSASRKFFS